MHSQNRASSEAKRRNAASTRARILSAARRAFAEIGYQQAGIRQIASAAGVDSALVSRYFGSKAGLFEAALSAAIPDISPATEGFATLSEARDDFGSLLTTQFLAGFFDLSAQSMIALSTSDAEARRISARVLKARAVEPIAQWLGPPNAQARAIRLVMLATGFTLFTRQVALLTPDEVVENGTSRWLSDILQDIVGG